MILIYHLKMASTGDIPLGEFKQITIGIKLHHNALQPLPQSNGMTNISATEAG